MIGPGIKGWTPVRFTDDADQAQAQSEKLFTESMSLLAPHMTGRWEGTAGRKQLARSAWESGWDAAIHMFEQSTTQTRKERP